MATLPLLLRIVVAGVPEALADAGIAFRSSEIATHFSGCAVILVDVAAGTAP